jgi:isocitrate lyase
VHDHRPYAAMSSHQAAQNGTAAAQNGTAAAQNGTAAAQNGIAAARNGAARAAGNGQARTAAANGHRSAAADQAARLQEHWASDPRWAGVQRTYGAQDVVRLRGSVQEEHTLARIGAERLWSLLHEDGYVNTLGALTGNQAVQQVRAGLRAIYLSGWQVAADANLAGQTYPDQSLYPVNSVPQVVRRINNALLRADQITWSEADGKPGASQPYWLAPIVADAEAGFGGVLNAFELMKAMIAAGASGVHWEDQLASEKKCGHLGGKVLIPTGQHIRTLNAARLAADVCGVPSLIVARTDAQKATLITSDVDERDQEFCTGERTAEGFYRVRGGIEPCIARGLAYAPYSDLLWMETSTPDLAVAREFAERIKSVYPDQMLAYNCSPSFNWRAHLDEGTIEKFQRELGELGYKFQFITLAGFHALNQSMFDLASGYAAEGMPAYVRLQDAEFAAEAQGYTATRHQREVGTGYFDLVTSAITPDSSTTALAGSTESEQFAVAH